MRSASSPRSGSISGRRGLICPPSQRKLAIALEGLGDDLWMMLDQVENGPSLVDHVILAEWGAVEVLVTKTSCDLDPVVTDRSSIYLDIAHGAFLKTEHCLDSSS